MNSELILVTMVSAAALTDIAARWIPNALVAGGLAIALMMHAFLPDGAGWQIAVLGALTGMIIFLPFYLARGMAAGDVKLMAAVGAFVGPALAVEIALATFLIGGVWSLTVIALTGKGQHAWRNIVSLLMRIFARSDAERAERARAFTTVGRLPYGVAIAIGTISVLMLEGG